MGIITRIEGKTTRTKKVKVAAYARVSTNSDDQLLSLETQKDHYEKYIKSNPNWEFAGLYFDEGISGTKVEKRKSLLELIRDCERGKIDRVITKSISRFSRNTVDCLEMVRRLTSLGIYLYFEKENIDTEHMSSELMLSILSSIAESESRSISENSKWSIRRKFENGTFIISYPPYGYKNENGVMVIIPKEAKVIKEIFDMALNGMGAEKISKELNRRKIKTKKNRMWHSNTILCILKNEKYTGDAIFQKTFTDDNYNRHKNNGEENMYLVKNHHEAIITHKDFDLVQELLAKKAIKDNENKSQRRYAFSGRIVCGKCGGTLKRKINSISKDKMVLWACKTHIDNKENCPMKSINDKDLKIAFIKMINKLITGKETVLKAFISDLEGINKSVTIKEINEKETILQELKERQRELIELLKSGYLEREVYWDESLKLTNEINTLEKDRNKISGELNNELVHLNEAKKLLQFISKVVKVTEFIEADFLEIVDKVTAIDRNKFIFHLKCGLNLTEEVNKI